MLSVNKLATMSFNGTTFALIQYEEPQTLYLFYLDFLR